MFGLSFDKLVVLALFAGLIIGPHRLGTITRTAVDTIRSLRSYVETQRTQLAADTGISLSGKEWSKVDIHQYDPRRIIQDALSAPTSLPPPNQTSAAVPPNDRYDLTDAVDEIGAIADTQTAAHAPSEVPILIRPGQKYLVIGNSAHPRRIRIADLPVDDPRRIAAAISDAPVETPPNPDLHPTDQLLGARLYIDATRLR